MAFKKLTAMQRKECDLGILPPGTRVRFSPAARKLGGKTGVVERFKTKRYSVYIGNQSWSVPPSIIEAVDTDGNGFDELQKAREAERERAEPHGDGTRNWHLDQVKVGDVVVFHRGSSAYDIAQVVRITERDKPFCKMLNGRSAGKTYGFQTRWYVGKLPKERFA